MSENIYVKPEMFKGHEEMPEGVTPEVIYKQMLNDAEILGAAAEILTLNSEACFKLLARRSPHFERDPKMTGVVIRIAFDLLNDFSKELADAVAIANSEEKKDD